MLRYPTADNWTITYTITVTNTGQVAFTAAEPATFTDDLSQVLDDAVYRNDGKASTGTLSYHKPNLAWSGALPIAGSASVTYSVFVDNPDRGDGKLRNAVLTPTDPGAPRDPGAWSVGNCPAGNDDSNCATTTTIDAAAVGAPNPPRPPSGPLAFTGINTPLELLLVGLLAVSGSLLILIGTRRRRTRR